MTTAQKAWWSVRMASTALAAALELVLVVPVMGVLIATRQWRLLARVDRMLGAHADALEAEQDALWKELRKP